MASLRVTVQLSSRGSTCFSANHFSRIHVGPRFDRLKTSRRNFTWLTSPSGGKVAPGAVNLPVGVEEHLAQQRAGRRRQMAVHEPDGGIARLISAKHLVEGAVVERRDARSV